jgi:hypothetical protein
LPAVAQSPIFLRQSGSADEPVEVPAKLICIRVSRDFLEDYVERTVHDQEAVEDKVLGAQIAGESETNGKTSIVLNTSDDHMSAEVEFVGTVQSSTVGRKGFAAMHYVSASVFRADKPIVLDDSGLNAAPATASVQTRLNTTRIDTTVPRIIHGIATRIAWRQDANSRSQAEEITSQHLATSISRRLDRQIDRSVAKVQETLRSQLALLEFDRASLPRDVRFRSTPDYVEIDMVRHGTTEDELSFLPPTIEGNPDIAIRVHRTVMKSVLVDSEVSRKLTPLLIKLLAGRIAQKTLAVVGAGIPSSQTKWKIDHNWLAVDFTDAKRDVATPIAANSIYR